MSMVVTPPSKIPYVIMYLWLSTVGSLKSRESGQPSIHAICMKIFGLVKSEKNESIGRVFSMVDNYHNLPAHLLGLVCVYYCHLPTCEEKKYGLHGSSFYRIDDKFMSNYLSEFIVFICSRLLMNVPYVVGMKLTELTRGCFGHNWEQFFWER